MWLRAEEARVIFKQYALGCLSQLSYLIGDETTGRAVVVDPHRDVSVYTGDAAANQLRIERVIETHCHADFLSGHLELAATGAVICYGQGVRTDFEAEHLADGQRLDLGQVQLEIRATPGHTPESISIVVYEHPGDSVPYGVLTGDALFIGDVGRPDLLSASGMTPTSMAGQLYRSLWGKLLTLPDATRVFPAHGAGSACGSASTAVRTPAAVFQYSRAPLRASVFASAVSSTSECSSLKRATTPSPPAVTSAPGSTATSCLKFSPVRAAVIVVPARRSTSSSERWS